jgi:hypothetical protein
MLIPSFEERLSLYTMEYCTSEKTAVTNTAVVKKVMRSFFIILQVVGLKGMALVIYIGYLRNISQKNIAI